ncbi:Uncharacterized protein TCM_039437 [Theobroma cacao]|uniref:Uncharacterized protein n=1 Tax=Theobroma cacao TaxID=3641 RepID=A0A061GQ88_THECC|nr:Uncharacterized protein TCM_039437 [Theobroma cacao]
MLSFFGRVDMAEGNTCLYFLDHKVWWFRLVDFEGVPLLDEAWVEMGWLGLIPSRTNSSKHDWNSHFHVTLVI